MGHIMKLFSILSILHLMLWHLLSSSVELWQNPQSREVSPWQSLSYLRPSHHFGPLLAPQLQSEKPHYLRLLASEVNSVWNEKQFWSLAQLECLASDIKSIPRIQDHSCPRLTPFRDCLAFWDTLSFWDASLFEELCKSETPLFLRCPSHLRLTTNQKFTLEPLFLKPSSLTHLVPATESETPLWNLSSFQGQPF